MERGKTLFEYTELQKYTTSADQSLCAFFITKSRISIFYIVSVLSDEILFQSDKNKHINELVVGLDFRNRICFDFSPNNKKFIFCINGNINIYDLEHHKLQYFICEFDPKNSFFLTNQIITLIDSSSYDSIVSIDISKNPHTIIKNKINSKWYPIWEKDLCFVNKKDKCILGIREPNCLTNSAQTNLLKITGEVLPGPIIHGISFAYIPRHGNTFNISLKCFNSDDRLILDFSDYALNGEVKIKNAETKKKFWKVFGVPFIKVNDPGILPNLKDKIYFKKFQLETFREKIMVISKKDFESEKLATLIGCGLVGGGSTWQKFLMRGLYDPRLWSLVWAFCWRYN